MKKTLRFMLVLPAFMLPILLACLPPGDPAPKGSSGTNTLTFRWDGGTSTVDGSYGTPIATSVSPSGSEGVRWHLDGPGTLLDIERKPVDLGSDLMPLSGWYVPPAQVPAGGLTVQFWIEVKSPISHLWERSQNFPIQVGHKTTAMLYEALAIENGGTPATATLHPGEMANFVVTLNPRPLDLQQWNELIPTQATTGSLGTVVISELDGTHWAFSYTAPAILDTQRDITLRALAHDPWMNLDLHVDFTIHLVP